MSNTVYPNQVLSSKLNDLLNTKLNVKALMVIDSDLAESAGMIKKINKYTYSGTVESVAAGQGNTVRGSITYSPVQYEVGIAQQTFDYQDEDFMQDPKVVDFSMEGASQTMVNDMNTKYFAELAKATIVQPYSTFSYDTVVDAISLMNIEDESGLFLVIGTDLKATIRKDQDFKAKELGKVIADGAIGTLSGVPVIVSKLVPDNVAYLATKEAVTLFTKEENEIEQDRDIERRTNTVVMRKVNLVALTDATKVVAILKYIAAPVITTASIAAGSNKTFAGTCVAGANITIYKDGVPLTVEVNGKDVVQKATVTGTNWTYTIATATASEVYSVVASKANFASKASANGITVA
jgi:hypothetical protein